MLRFSLFEKHPQLIHGIFDKNYGNFSPNHDSLNKVEDNVKKLSEELKISPANMVSVNQVHSTNIVNIKSKKEKQLINKRKIDADGLITNLPNTFLLLKTADCIPLFIFDPKNNAVGLIHIGWRGAVAKIHEKAIGMIESNFKSKRNDLLIGLGPSVCAKCYVSTQKPQQTSVNHWRKHISKRSNGWHVDLSSFVLDTLVRCNIPQKNIQITNQCTCESNLWFSHTRSKKSGEPEGRFASILGLRP